MKATDFIRLSIDTKPDEERFKKWQLRPMGGWPGGVDPYPNAMEEDFVMAMVRGHDHTLRGTSMRSFNLGEAFCLECDGKTLLFYVNEVESTFQPHPLHTITATART